jgi:3'(2'), 5'-bisphosphate nucleotidase
MYELEKSIAIAAVTVASRFCQQIRYGHQTQAVTKADTSPVTIADFGAQALICQALAEAFPDDPVIAEEDSSLLRKPEFAEVLRGITAGIREFKPEISSESILDWIDRGNGEIASRYWTLDPIDGTKGFIRGDQYTVKPLSRKGFKPLANSESRKTATNII